MKAPLLCALLVLAALGPAPIPAQASPLAIEPQGRQGAYDVYLARDEAGREITLLVEGPLSDAHKQTLEQLRDRALGFKALRLRSARALITPAAIDVLVVPSQYVVEGQDLTPFLPGGLLFHFEDALRYDFRMLVGHYFLRMAGPFESEEAFSRRLLEAARTPAAFLKADTMEYVSDKFSALDARVTEVERRGGAALRDLEAGRAELTALRNDSATFKAEAAALKEEQASLRAAQLTARTELDAVKASLLNPAGGRIDADVQALQQALGAAGADIEALRTVVVVLQSRNGNFNRRGVDREAISRLVALKRATPTLTQTDAAAALKAEGLSMSKKDIALVFGVFFVDYR